MRSPKKTLLHILMHIGKLLEIRVQGRLAGVGVHHGQARVLAALCRHGSMTQADLARGVGCTPATMSNMLRPMDQQGWIDRSTDPKTNRATVVRLTRRGGALAVQVDAAWKAVETDLRGALPDLPVEDFLRDCEAVRRALGGQAPKFVPYEERNRR